MRPRGGDLWAFGASSRVVISRGTQIEVNVAWSSTDKGVQMVASDKVCNPCFHPHPVLVSNESETGK